MTCPAGCDSGGDRRRGGTLLLGMEGWECWWRQKEGRELRVVVVEGWGAEGGSGVVGWLFNVGRHTK